MTARELQEHPDILLNTSDCCFGNKQLPWQGLQLCLSYCILYKVAASLHYHTIQCIFCEKRSILLVLNQVSAKVLEYLAQNTFLQCQSLLKNYLTGKTRKTLHLHFPVFLSLRRVVRLSNSYGEAPVKMLAVIMHTNFHHCLMSIFTLTRKS